MQLTAKLKNKSTSWSALLKARVLDVVTNAGTYYQNVSGINGNLTDTTHWFPIFSTPAIATEYDRLATDITGTDPDFVINLSSSGMPAFPASIRVYVDLNNTNDYQPLEPVNYVPGTGILHGMNDPAAYPNQRIRIMVI